MGYSRPGLACAHNGHRLVVAVDFEKGIVWIEWIGTHRDYDRIEVTEVEHERG